MACFTIYLISFKLFWSSFLHSSQNCLLVGDGGFQPIGPLPCGTSALPSSHHISADAPPHSRQWATTFPLLSHPVPANEPPHSRKRATTFPIMSHHITANEPPHAFPLMSHHIPANEPPHARQCASVRTSELYADVIFLYLLGVKWHDVSCNHEKPIICEDEPGHINFVLGK